MALELNNQSWYDIKQRNQTKSRPLYILIMFLYAYDMFFYI